MECPNCGSSQIGYRVIIDMTGYQCQDCGLKWMEMGPPRFIREMERATAEWLAAVKSYAVCGVVVWLILSPMYFVICIQQPLNSVTALSVKTWGSLLLFVILTGFCLGQSLLGALQFTGKWFPGWKAAHTIGPFLAAISVGGLSSLVLLGMSIEAFQDDLQMRSPTVCLVVGVVLAMLATPIIIVRSVARLKRLGFRREYQHRNRKDERWDC